MLLVHACCQQSACQYPLVRQCAVDGSEPRLELDSPGGAVTQPQGRDGWLTSPLDSAVWARICARTWKGKKLAVHLAFVDASAEAAMAEPAVLLAAVRGCDQAALTQLVAGYDHALLRLAFVITGNRPAAEDAAQATWNSSGGSPPVTRAGEGAVMAADRLRQRGPPGGAATTARRCAGSL